MPRDLADVLHYFLPELEDDSMSEDELRSRDEVSVPQDPLRMRETALPPAIRLLGIPISDRDVVRAALTWNLAVEFARLGRRAIVLAPASKAHAPLWPESGVGPLGAEMRFCPASSLEELEAAAHELSQTCSTSTARDSGALFVHVPPEWLTREGPTPQPISWWLLMSSADHTDLSEAHRLETAIRSTATNSTVGITIHGVSSIQEARQAYEHVSRLCTEEPGHELVSYGLLVDDLHVYRAIAAQRPIGLEHPQAPATRALMDVARLLGEDAGSQSLG